MVRLPKTYVREGREYAYFGSEHDDMYDWFNPNDRRTPEEYPYAYSMYYLWGGHVARQRSAENRPFQTVYHDRMIGWARDKEQAGEPNPWTRATRAVFGDERQMGLQSLMPHTASKFLTEYYGRRITCIAMCQCCNQSSGYPIWVFMFTEEEKPAE